jgi:hypothetical protein
LYFVRRDKKVVGVFVRFRASCRIGSHATVGQLQQTICNGLVFPYSRMLVAAEFAE